MHRRHAEPVDQRIAAAHLNPEWKHTFQRDVLCLLLTLVALICPSLRLSAASASDVVINEIAWMGTEASATDEWLELHNTTDHPIDIEGWSIYGADTAATLDFSAADGHATCIIPAHGYLLYANHQDDVTDQAGTGIVDVWDATIGMNNTSPGRLILYDGMGTVIDVVNAETDDWFAGEAAPRHLTMERVEPLAPGDAVENWRSNDPSIIRTGFDADGTPINGTPKARNSATNAGPVASAGEDQVVLVTETAQLDGSASFDPDGDPLTYAWTFNSRPAESAAILSGAETAQPAFIPDVSGTYVVSLMIIDFYRGTAADKVTVFAQVPPHAAFGFAPATPTVWDTIAFTCRSTDADGTITVWSWQFGDDATDDDPDPRHRFWTPGTYRVALEVTDDDGLTDTTTREITVILGPGDLDADGALTALDAHVCHQIVAGTVTPTAAQRAQADVDGDGDVDLDDAQALAWFLIRR